MNTIEIGNKELEVGEIFSATEPTPGQMAAFCNTLKLLIESRVPILEAIVLTSKTVEHPWLLATLSFIQHRIREGETITDSVGNGFSQLIESRVSELETRGKFPESWRDVHRGEWAIPDFMGYFSLFISMVEVGEETGELDTALVHIRQMYQHEKGFGERTWGREIAILNRALAMMFSAGLPPRAIGRILYDLPALYELRPELKIVLDELDNDAELSRAFAKTDGKLADPVYVGLIEVGEKTGLISWSVFEN